MKEGTRLISQLPSYPEQRSREVLREHKDKQQEAGVSKTAQSKWVSSFIMVYRKDKIFQFCVDNGCVDITTIPDASPLSRTDD